MDDIKIEIFKCRWGESFLVTCNGIKKPIHILIDMGFEDSYNNYIKPRLQKISEEGKLDYLVFTHIDSDHISGGLKFLSDNGCKGGRNIIDIGDIWYNAYRHLQFGSRSSELISKVDKKKLSYSIISGMHMPELGSYKEATAEEGSILGALILKGKYNWNSKFFGNTIHIDAKQDECENDEVSFKILSPNTDDLKELEEEWKEQLSKLGIYKITSDNVFDDAFEVLMSREYKDYFTDDYTQVSAEEYYLKDYINKSKYKDKSPTNGSSISFVLEFSKKRILFLADSHHERIIDSLKNIYNPKENEKIFFDTIKVSHHGSCGNSSTKLYDLIDSDKFIISTNGEIYNHPSMQTIAQIVCRPTIKERVLYFNYDNILNKFNNEEWMYKYKYRLKKIENDVIEITLTETGGQK